MDQTGDSALTQKLDQALEECVEEIKILPAVAPLNYDEQKKIFFQSNYSITPEFCYKPRSINPLMTKRALYNLPIEELKNEDLYHLYHGVINSFAAKADQYNVAGTPEFLYESLKYYGEPDDKDLSNAQFLLHLPNHLTESEKETLNAQDITQALATFAKTQGYEHTMVSKTGMIAKAMVSGTTVYINASAKISKTELEALAHHELGVHLVTTLNAKAQQLKIFDLGLPLFTMTQEGIAILCEYLAGYMTLGRIKTLALRVLAVQSLLKEKDFKKTFLLLKEDYATPDEQAFTITARVYRGGGFTKDFLYLRGLHEMLNAYENTNDFQRLLCGKVSIAYLPIINRLIEQGIVAEPKYISPAMINPIQQDAVRQFIAHAIR